MKFASTNFVVLGVITALGLSTWNRLNESKTAARVESLVHTIQAAKNLKKEHVVDLPEDGNRWYTTVIYKDDDKSDTQDRRLAAMLADPTIARFINQTTFNQWDAGHRLYEARYRKYFGGELPGFCVQDHTGKVCYLARGENLPESADQLAKELEYAIDRCRPRPRPKPDDTPKPKPDPKPAVIPNIRPSKPLSPKKDDWPLAALLIPLAGAGFGVYQNWKKSIA